MIGVLGSVDHRDLRAVARVVAEAGDEIATDGSGGVATAARLEARRLGVPVFVGSRGEVARASRGLDLFPWDDATELGELMAESSRAGVPVEVHDQGAPRALVYSCRINYTGVGAVDITRGSGSGDALAFAPSKSLLDRTLGTRAEAEKLRNAAHQLAQAQLVLGEDPAERAGRAAALLRHAETLEAASWNWYAPRYRAEMLVSCGVTEASPAWGKLSSEDRDLMREAIVRGARSNVRAWRWMLARPLTVLCCYCTSADRCHRGLLGGFLARRGAAYRGELP